MADALFTINDDSSDHGYDAEPEELLTLKLKTLPVSGVSSVRFQVWDESLFDATQDVFRNPPLKSKDAPDLLLDNGDETGASLAPLAVDGAVTTELPSTTGHAWIIRCVVNGGMSERADGKIVVDPRLIHERMVVVRDADGFRPIVATETRQYDPIHGWAPEAGLPGADGATGPTGPQGPSGASSALRRIRRHLFKPDGTCDITENGITTNVALTEFSLETDGNAYKVWVCPGGTGGNRSSKHRNTTASDATGAGGPGGGAINEDLFYREDLEAYIAALGTPIPVIAGAGGPGAPDGAFGEINTSGAQGTLGGLSAFGALCVAYPGGRGQSNGGISSSAQGGGGGGGWGGPGLDGSTSSSSASRPVTNLGSSNAQGDGNFGGGTGWSGSNTTGPGLGVYGGGGGGGNSSGSGANGLPAGRSLKGIPGAGSGGSVDATGPTPRNGGAAGKRGFYTDATQANDASVNGGGPAGGTGVTGTTGNDGADGADGIPGLYPGESGAGGGALVCTGAGGTGLSGRGGDGGYPGGSGGSGGACFNDSDTLVANCAAAGGGDGADGCVVVDTLG